VTGDGRFAVTAPVHAERGRDLGLLTLDEPPDSPRIERPLLSTEFLEQGAALSPDNRWLAYSSNETGREEVYVRPFPGGGAKIRVSTDGGSEPVWHPGGRELFYVGLRNGLPHLYAAKVRQDPEFVVLERTPLFDFSEFEPASPHPNYDLSPDGSRFAMVYQGPLTQLVYVLNWPEEIRRRGR
jgi:serine/threonine-protein kinase